MRYFVGHLVFSDSGLLSRHFQCFQTKKIDWHCVSVVCKHLERSNINCKCSRDLMFNFFCVVNFPFLSLFQPQIFLKEIMVIVAGTKRPALSPTNLQLPNVREPVEYVMSPVILGSPVPRASKKVLEISCRSFVIFVKNETNFVLR